MKTVGVYGIFNLVTGKVYVGSSGHVLQRLSKHRYRLNLGKHHASYLQRSWCQHGSGAFLYVILEVCAEDELLRVEQKWIDTFSSSNPDNGYNTAAVAGSTRGIRLSDERKALVSSVHRGKTISPEHRAILSRAHKGRAQSQELIAKRMASKARTIAAQKAAGISHSKPLSEEHRRKIGAAHKGKTISEDQKMKFRATLAAKKNQQVAA